MFAPRILKSASRELKRIDPPIAQRIVDRIRWLAENFERITPEPLKGNLAGFSKLREKEQQELANPRLREHRKDKSPFSVLPLRLAGAPTVTSNPNASALTSR
jgi:mRNA-degrading endonuclease RelE of RelBE toxin-antitoxin system